jgi:hypothetical protein
MIRDKIEGYLMIGTNGRREVVVNLDRDRTGHIVFSPGQARTLAALLLRKADDADQQLHRPEPQRTAEAPPQARRIDAFGKFGIYTPYESHDGSVGWTVQRFEPADDQDELGEVIAEFAEEHNARLFAEAAFEAGRVLIQDKMRDKYEPEDGA